MFLSRLCYVTRQTAKRNVTPAKRRAFVSLTCADVIAVQAQPGPRMQRGRLSCRPPVTSSTTLTPPGPAAEGPLETGPQTPMLQVYGKSYWALIDK